jgi:hypothetical protein
MTEREMIKALVEAVRRGDYVTAAELARRLMCLKGER